MFRGYLKHLLPLVMNYSRKLVKRAFIFWGMIVATDYSVSNHNQTINLTQPRSKTVLIFIQGNDILTIESS